MTTEGTWELRMRNESLNVCPDSSNRRWERRQKEERAEAQTGTRNGTLLFLANEASHTRPRAPMGPAGA